jgi:DNA-binding transcriptional LysR family regulator
MAFVTVAKYRNITKAAQELRVTQPSISKHLKALEKQYQVRLIEKEAGKMALTDEGTVFLHYASAVLSLLEQLDSKFGTFRSKQRVEPLKVGGSYGASTRLLPSLVARFKKQHPEIPIALRSGSSKTLEKMLLNSEAEIALVHMKPVNSCLCAEPFREEKLIMFVARNHPLASRKTVSISDLNISQLAATGGRNSTTEKILKGLAKEGLNARVTIRCETPDAVKIIVGKGIGVGILFQDTITPEIKKGTFKSITLNGVKLTGHSYIVYRQDKPMSINAREFLSLLRNWRGKR